MNEGRSPIPLTRPLMDDREADAARRVILSGWITQGPEVAAFEREFAELVGAPHSCAVSNCTAALRLALQAAGTRPGDEVITVSHSFIATANVVRHCGAVPVFVDIEPGTLNVCPGRIEQAITPRTRCILAVHQVGMPCDLAAIGAIGDRHGLPIIEDAACATGSEIQWRGNWERIGKPHGAAACFSFHPRKLVTTGDGGMITTANPEWDRLFRLWRQHGMSVPDSVRHGAREVVFENYLMLGDNVRMTDLQAAVGREQLKRLPEMIARRRHLVDRYRALLADVPGLVLPEEPAWARSNWQSFCVGLPEGCDQRRVMQELLDEGIATRRGIMCAHREPAYAAGGEAWSCGLGPGPCGCAAGSCRRLAESERAQDRRIILPLFSSMTEADQEAVASVMLRACDDRGSA